jgi:hypothetical protein
MIDRLITAAITVVLWEFRFEILGYIGSLLSMTA